MLIISLLFGYITSAQITKPLTAIISKIKSIANGNLSERCENEGDDEFKELAQNINIMAANLEMDTIKLKRYAYIDGLTGLPNRTSIYKDIDKKFKKNKNQAVILLDLDKFKYINDNLGHQYGDETLKEVSKVLMKIKSDTCFPCRWGGDEFLVFVSYFNDKKELDFIAEYILKSIENLNLVSNNKIAFSTSIGIALLDEKDTDIIQIIKRADKAMYRVKNGNNDNKILYYTKI
jgi:diguanylate cyclase (GGDEF)-like protein